MAMTFTTLTGAKTVEGSIKNWVVRTDTPSTTVLTEAEAWIYERLRVREMMTRETFTFLINTSTLALPSGFLDPIGYRPWQWGDDLPYVHEAAYRPSTDSTGALTAGEPGHWTIIGTTAYVDVKCSAAFGGDLMYFKQPDALSVSNETNFLTDRYPTLLRRACLMFAWEHARNWERRKEELQLAEAALASVQASDEMFRRTQSFPV